MHEMLSIIEIVKNLKNLNHSMMKMAWGFRFLEDLNKTGTYCAMVCITLAAKAQFSGLISYICLSNQSCKTKFLVMDRVRLGWCLQL